MLGKHTHEQRHVARNGCCDGNVRLGREDADAAQFASWGVRYLKYDDCGEANIQSFAKYSVMKDALAAAGGLDYYSFGVCARLQFWSREDTQAVTHCDSQVSKVTPCFRAISSLRGWSSASDGLGGGGVHHV